MKKLLYLLFLAFFFSVKGLAQPSWYSGTLLFNFSEEPYIKPNITIDDFKNKTIQLLSSDENSTLKYDTINKAFSFTTKIGYEVKSFAVVHQKDTIFIDFPASGRHKTNVFVKTPIPLSRESFSFFDMKIIDAMIANYQYGKDNTFSLCQYCSFSQYEMEKERKEQLKKLVHLWYAIKLEE